MNNKAHLRPKDFDSNGDIIPMACKEGKGDLISREALKEAFADMREGYPIFSDTEMVSTKDIASIIDNAPTVEARPQGVWIEDYTESCHSFLGYHCSECSADALEKNDYSYNSNYCPNCGAKMQKGGAE